MADGATEQAVRTFWPLARFAQRAYPDAFEGRLLFAGADIANSAPSGAHFEQAVNLLQRVVHKIPVHEREKYPALIKFVAEKSC